MHGAKIKMISKGQMFILLILDYSVPWLYCFY